MKLDMLLRDALLVSKQIMLLSDWILLGLPNTCVDSLLLAGGELGMESRI
jgi:hypothetical protein